MQAERMTVAGPQPLDAPAWLHHAATGRRFALVGARGVHVIGRGAPTEIALGADPFVSRRHAQIVAIDGEFWLSDLESANGSFLNQRQVTAAERLQPGDLIQVGNTALRFERAAGGGAS